MNNDDHKQAPATAKTKRGKRSPQRSRSSKRNIVREQLRSRALALRAQGWTFAVISTTMKEEMPGSRVGPQTARNLVDEALRDLVVPPTEEVRNLYRTRLDELLSVYYPVALGGDIQAGAMCLQIMDRIEKLEGLDKPRPPVGGSGDGGNERKITIVGGLPPVDYGEPAAVPAVIEGTVNPQPEDVKQPA